MPFGQVRIEELQSVPLPSPGLPPNEAQLVVHLYTSTCVLAAALLLLLLIKVTYVFVPSVEVATA